MANALKIVTFFLCSFFGFYLLIQRQKQQLGVSYPMPVSLHDLAMCDSYFLLSFNSTQSTRNKWLRNYTLNKSLGHVTKHNPTKGLAMAYKAMTRIPCKFYRVCLSLAWQLMQSFSLLLVQCSDRDSNCRIWALIDEGIWNGDKANLINKQL